MISEDSGVGKALAYLADTDESFAQQKADVSRLEKKEKTILATEFLNASGPVAEREAKARTSDAYREWLVDHEKAVLDYEITRVRRSHSELVIEVWRTMSANQRRGNI